MEQAFNWRSGPEGSIHTRIRDLPGRANMGLKERGGPPTHS
jgi:hypothetical protein